jgi:ribosomal protein L44E
MNHAGIVGNCASCHNGAMALGKPTNHIVTNAPCEACHKSTTTFAGARVDHSRITAPCASCHNGTTAPGKPPGHIVTSASCENCHKSTVTFAGARMDHTGIIGNCVSCHNGKTALGKPTNHIATNASCETCHKSTMTFAGARLDHSRVTAPCASCHNGTTAPGKPPRHFVTTLPCEMCHRTMTWTPVIYRHTSPAYVNHAATLGCTSCHASNAQIVPSKFPAFRPDCASCHADKYRPTSHLKFAKPVTVYYTVMELRDCAGACHIYTDNTQRTVLTRLTGVHRAIGGGW